MVRFPACARCNIKREGRRGILRYKIDQIEITAPLPTVPLADGETGVGLLFRRHDRPIGYLLRETDTPLSPQTLHAWIGQELGGKILEEILREELSPPTPDADPPTLTVAICTRARADVLARCLSSLSRLGEDCEILVVDNAPPDDTTAALVRTLPHVRYTTEPRPGLDFARNRAWREATREWIAYLDDDAIVDAGWYDGLQAVWRENPDAAAITGLVLPTELSTHAQILFEKRGGFRRGFDTRRYGRTLPGNASHPAGAGMFGTGCNMAFRRTVLRELGGFDEALDTGRPLPGGGDLDMFFRLLVAGHILVYEPRCLVFHEHRKTEAALRHQYYTWGLGLMAYAGKHLRPGEPRRELFLRLIRWWARDLFRQIKDALRGRHPLPVTMLLAELGGGVVGLCGEYARSQRRSEKIKSAHP